MIGSGRSRTGLALAVLVIGCLTGCNTVAGFGEDITGTARWTQGRLGSGGFAASTGADYDVGPSYQVPDDGSVQVGVPGL